MKRLRELREQRGLTLEQVATDLDLKNQYISNYELGKRRPDFEILKKFADYYNVSTDYLLENSDYKEKYSDVEAAEILRKELIKIGVLKDGEDLSSEQLEELLKKVGVIINTLR